MIYIRFIDSFVKGSLVTRLESRHFGRNVQTIPTKPNPVGHSSSFFSIFFLLYTNKQMLWILLSYYPFCNNEIFKWLLGFFGGLHLKGSFSGSKTRGYVAFTVGKKIFKKKIQKIQVGYSGFWLWWLINFHTHMQASPICRKYPFPSLVVLFYLSPL